MSDDTRDATRNDTRSDTDGPADPTGIGRRDLLKALASVPVLGVFFAGWYQKKLTDDAKREAIMAELGLEGRAPAVIPNAVSRPPGDRVRVGIVGFGGEGESLGRCLGFAHPDWIEMEAENHRDNPANKSLEVFMGQDDLNVSITAVCDLFDVRAERAVMAAANASGPGGATAVAATRYRRYDELLESDVDAVVIATPDHWHTRIALDAVAAGKHVYVEKAMTRTEEEALQMYDAVTASDITFQVGHQQRQSETHIKAREVVDAGVLGHVSLVEVTTNRNAPWGAWVYGIDERGTPQTIDWDQFQEPSENKVAFSPERFFRWRCWWDYGTGLAGDLMSHEYDAVNQILALGIPESVVSSGGIYYFKDGREVPDVWQAVCEYPERDLTLMYSATLANSLYRGQVFMGHDATMQVGQTLNVTADPYSTRYREKIDDAVIDPSRPMFSYNPRTSGVDAVTSATAAYFAQRGLLYTWRDGKMVNSYHLHIKEWIDAIRGHAQTSCGIEEGFQEAITCHMATRAYRENRRVRWDPVARRIV
ncbi:MAG: Gfo/Idh/MocA family oxidoreductase [Gemmatimonadetes bacterium]|nr:Gfo/Idh/MocA family oxidoreductase [Gemmatimonadota bacterium]